MVNENEENTLKKLKLIREHAWSYFEYHAAQRILLFRFFIIFISLTSGGAVFFLKEYPSTGKLEEVCGLILSIVIMVVIIVFYLLDERNRDLIHIAEEGLIDFEKVSFHPELEPNRTLTPEDLREKYPKYAVFTKEPGHKSKANHTSLFHAIFVVSFILAILLLLYSSIYLFCPKHFEKAKAVNETSLNIQKIVKCIDKNLCENH